MKKTSLLYLITALVLVAAGNIQALFAQQPNSISFAAPIIIGVFGSSPQTIKVNFVDTNVGEVGYLFYYSTSPDGPFQIDDSFAQSGLDSGNVITYQTNSGYDENTLLYLKVAAFDYNSETGEYTTIGPFSELDTARTMAGWPPGPSDFIATAEGGTIHLTWTDNSKAGDPLDEAVWGLSRSTDGGNFNKGYSLPAETESFIDNDVTPYVTYYYRLEPYNVFGVGNFIYGATAMALPAANNQTIEFTSASNKTIGDAAFNLHAVASSGLPVTYKSSNAAVATINANTVTIIGAGVTTITASQPGNENYLAAPDVSKILTVNEALTTPVLYGLTSANGQSEIGTVFTSNLDGSELKSIYNFTFATSQRPIGSLVRGIDGFLYGMARSVGNDGGTIFKINADGSGYTELHNFNAYPSASSLIQTTDGTLFGMTSPFANGLQGRLFKINTDGSGYQDLQSLGSGGEPGFLMQASNGSIYGTDASTGFGNIFRMNADGSGYTVLHTFNGTDGSFVYGALMEATDGSLYGVASQGGPANIGTIFKIDTNGTGFTVLHNFYLSQEGVTPSETLVQAPDGSPYLYGMTLTGGQYNSGLIYKINMTGDDYTVLHTFTGSDGARPACRLIHIGNTLYGYTTNGGLAGGGVIFNYDLQTSSYHKLVDFSAATGMSPVFGGLLLMSRPTIDKPTIPASNISFSNILSTSMTVSFTPGNGSQHLVVMKAGAPPAFKPADSTVYGMSQDLGNGETIVSTGNESTINVAGLNQLTRYYFTVFESAKDSVGTIRYLTTNAPVASAETSVSDYGIYKWNGIGWNNLPGVKAIRIAVDENGNPWVVNSNHDIYQYVNNAFIQRPGKANDIGIGGGQVCIVGVNHVGSGADFGIYKWNGSGWDNLPGGGVRIAVDSNGQPWLTNSVKNIYRYVNNGWLLMPGLANDIGIGGGMAWVLGTNPVGTGSDFGIYRWNGSAWINLPGGGVTIAADENGQPWVTNSVKDIYQFVNNAWKKLPGQANDIGIGGGKACIIGNGLPGATGIKNFSLINTATNEVLSTFEDSVTVDIARVDFSTLIVRANTNAVNLGSVSFLLDGVKTNVDNNTPYQIKKSAFQSLSEGSHWLQANAFTKRDGNGFQEESKGAVITIINSSGVTHFDIVNTAGIVLKELHDNDVINIANAAFKKITIVAHVTNNKIGSVVFTLNDVRHIENIAPYAFNGDHNGYYTPWPFSAGKYLLSGAPYSKANGKGNAGEVNSLSFWVINTDTLSTIANGRLAEQEPMLIESSELSLYPVPTQDEINVVLTGSEKIIEVRIISTTGQVHFKSDKLDGSKLITISTSKLGLAPGVYLLQAINNNGRMVVKKLIKQ